MKRNSRKTTQVKVCHVCGNKGFTNALIDCSKCPHTFAHQYCMGIPPGSIDSSFTWVCKDCCEQAEHRPNISMMPGDVTTKSSEEACDVSIDVTGTIPNMKPFTSLHSQSCTHKDTGNKQKCKRDSPKRDMEALSSFRSWHKVKRLKDQFLSTDKDDMGDDIATNMSAIDNLELILSEEQPEPLRTLLPIEYNGSSEQAETSYGHSRTKPKSTGHLLHRSNEHCGPISSIMDRPREITSGVVLLVSPLGEIHIERASFRDDLYPASVGNAASEA